MHPYAYTLDSKWVFFSFMLFQGNLIFVFVYQKLTLAGFSKNSPSITSTWKELSFSLP